MEELLHTMLYRRNFYLAAGAGLAWLLYRQTRKSLRPLAVATTRSVLNLSDHVSEFTDSIRQGWQNLLAEARAEVQEQRAAHARPPEQPDTVEPDIEQQAARQVSVTRPAFISPSTPLPSTTIETLVKNTEMQEPEDL
ncbi:MAG: hypothetical protein ACUVTU_01740 [Desulfurispora sp.]|uniref:hypothetical protein n=1 Tax=Desulfurispora sp. TaxID=3014275 RepID=UPI00404A6779